MLVSCQKDFQEFFLALFQSVYNFKSLLVNNSFDDFTFSMNFSKQIFSNDFLIQKRRAYVYYSHIPINYLDLRHISESNGCGILHLAGQVAPNLTTINVIFN